MSDKRFFDLRPGQVEPADLTDWLNLYHDHQADLREAGRLAEASAWLDQEILGQGQDESVFQANLAQLAAQDPTFHRRLVSLPPRPNEPLALLLVGDLLLVKEPLWRPYRLDVLMKSKEFESWGGWTAGVSVIRVINPIQFFILTQAPPHYAQGWAKTEKHLVVDLDQARSWLKAIPLSPAYARPDQAFRLFDLERLEEDYLDHTYCDTVIISQEPGVRPRVQAIVDHADRLIDDLILRLTDQVERRAGLARAGAEPVRAAFITDNQSTYIKHSTAHLALGFRRLGCLTLIISQEPNQVFTRVLPNLRRLADFQPDMVMAINNSRAEVSWLPPNLPMVSWLQDWSDRFLGLDGRLSLTPQDHFFSPSPRHQLIFGRNYADQGGRMHFLPPVADEEVFRPVPAEPCWDVTYVTHLYVDDSWADVLADRRPQGPLTLSFLCAWTLYHLPLLRINQLLADRPALLAEINHAAAQFGGEVSEVYLNRVWEECFFRHWKLAAVVRPVLHLARQGLKLGLFGRGWDQIPELAHQAQGPVDSREALNLLTNQSRINLNLSPNTSLHPRAVEILLSGGFMLTPDKGVYDSCPLADFLSQENVALFQDEEDLSAQVRFYLDQPGRREEMARGARAEALTRFTPQAGARAVLRRVMDRG